MSHVCAADLSLCVCVQVYASDDVGYLLVACYNKLQYRINVLNLLQCVMHHVSFGQPYSMTVDEPSQLLVLSLPTNRLCPRLGPSGLAMAIAKALPTPKCTHQGAPRRLPRTGR